MTPMPAGQALLNARCPRCGGGFECGAQAGHCACFDIRLSEALRAQLAAQYSSCLCLSCLRAVIDAAPCRDAPSAA